MGSDRSGRPARLTGGTGWRPRRPFDRGVTSLVAHKAYIDGLGWENFDPEEFLEGGARAAGTRLGAPMATSFEVFSIGWGDD